MTEEQILEQGRKLSEKVDKLHFTAHGISRAERIKLQHMIDCAVANELLKLQGKTWTDKVNEQISKLN